MTYANIQTSVTLDAVKLLKLACEGLRVQKEIVELLSQNEVRGVMKNINYLDGNTIPSLLEIAKEKKTCVRHKKRFQ